ncbi:MAG: UvrD-helicase domain-containing protein [Gammaproteobacteria bacterium]|nr:UvrD-helicase domain-containing protein [Gammaproteobacteria bacterium]
MAEIADQAERTRALDPRESFVVQAPAGSGKTGLLTQRFLRLLAGVESPEEIVAITFTVKAASEMRNRILAALQSAAGDTPPADHYHRRTWELARKVCERDAQRGWRLAQHPARLRIQTVDSLNAELVRQMPVLSGSGGPPRIAELPQVLYEQAARRTLALLDDGSAEESAALRVLLEHVDNDLPRAVALLSDMLARRDQWLRHIGAGGSTDGAALELAFRHEIEHQLQLAMVAIPHDLKPELAELAAFAAGALRAKGSNSTLLACAELPAFPLATLEALPVWRGLAALLLTQADDWRKTVDAKLGFDPAHRGEKTRLLEVLRRLCADRQLPAVLGRIRRLPAGPLDAAQLRVLNALLALLPLAVAQLQVLFAERGEVDYAEVALRAVRALGSAEAPTDLALALDYRIHHLLVDEFQDTSFNQFALLERLTAGWQPGDGRSLFVVGDPMQSIYRFREAEVGLFLRAQQSGIGALPLTELRLSVNFRSRPALLEWINSAFERVFPQHVDMASGALAYSPCTPARAPDASASVQVHAAFGKNSEREAVEILATIRAAHAAGHKVAVLVRGRNHLAALVPLLRREDLRFRAMELEQLGERPVVRDLMSLTRLLWHGGDRTAWLAVLRAPWSGLTLADLHALAGDDETRTLSEVLNDETRVTRLSPDGRLRYLRMRRILQEALAAQRRASLRVQVEQLWLQLGGPAVCASGEDLEDAEAFLALLESFDAGGTLADMGAFEAALAELYAEPDPDADDRLQVMTIHKAKGLEFDVVIVPGLGTGGGRASRPLLMYLERTRASGEPDLLLAPLNARGSDQDPHYELVLALRAEQEDFERQRLLYVAATRAREALHLFGHVKYSGKHGVRELKAPAASTLLQALWPAVAGDFEKALRGYVASAEAGTGSAPQVRLRRVPCGWQPPAPPADVAWQGAGTLAAAPPPLEFDWAGDTLRHIGTVVHRLLQRIATAEGDVQDAARVAMGTDRVRAWLQQAGVPAEELPGAVQTVQQAVERMLADDTGRRLLAVRGPDARCEFALSGFENRRLVTGVIDRSFVDNDGVCWIVDYKTSRHEGAEREAFLAREAERYRPQLRRYVTLMRAFGNRPVKAGLYFPLLGSFHEVDVDLE